MDRITMKRERATGKTERSGRPAGKIELLAPAGSYETFRAVLRAGADAVYLGGSRFGARAYADNFSEAELLLAIDEAHIHGRRVYLAVNTLLKEQELETELCRYLLPYYRQGLDAVIVQDMGVLSLIREAFPGLPVHASTQLTVTGSDGASFLRELGAERIVTARELSLPEIRRIHQSVPVEIESFVHGALCYCYSGQCLLSSMIGGRSGNRGRCAQPCRLPYTVCDGEGKRAGQAGSYILSPKDLCTIEHIPLLAENGVSSFKIEGRMKQTEYAAGVVSVYRDYIDRYEEELERQRALGLSEEEAGRRAREAYRVSRTDIRRLSELGNRSGFTDGYYFRRNGKEMITFDSPGYTRTDAGRKTCVRESAIKEKITGILRIKKDFPVTMEAACRGFAVSVSGDVARRAEKQPLSAEKIAENIKKTGNTPFEFGELQIEMDGELFLPVRSLNSLRRETLDALQKAMLAQFCREAEESIPGSADVRHKAWNPCDREQDGKQGAGRGDDAGETVSGRLRSVVSVEERAQLAPALEFDFVDEICLDSSAYMRDNLLKDLRADLAGIRGRGKRACFILPAVFRNNTADFYRGIADGLRGLRPDAFVVKSCDAAWFVRQVFAGEIPVIADHSLYTYNHRAKQVIGELPLLRDTVPLELNRTEIRQRDNRNSEMVIYGYLPLMTSAQCVRANSGCCDRQSGVLYLKDRLGNNFPVRNHCAECYNVVYNTAPLMLPGDGKTLREMRRETGISTYRISFTVEDAGMVRQVLELYRDVFVTGKPAEKKHLPGRYTHGHYRRGVE